LALAQQQVNNRRETFQFNTGLQHIQYRHEVDKMLKMMADDDEIIRLRTSIRLSSEVKFANGVITVGELLKDISAESQALLGKSLHELEWLKSLYEMKLIMNYEL
jgi:fructose-1,6-bisphosphatase/sedoheptulose 1,7-bisphosphatase-like protein